MSATQKIFYGPAGTGKTFRAAREAVRAVSPQTYTEALRQPDPEAALAEAHKQLVKDGRIVWVTFHPSYSYEDFVEGYRPIADEKGTLTYKVVDGPFKTVCNRARGETDLQIGELLRDARGKEAGQVVDKDAGGWLVRIRPDREDEVAPELYKYASRLILQRFIDASLPPSVFSIPGNTLVDLHDYGINENDADVPKPDPKKEEVGHVRIGNNVRRIVGGRARVSSSDLANSSQYGSVYRRLLELREGGTPSAMAIVIDEINRADLSRVFGELLTLLELDKREGMPEEKRIWLPYSKTLFSVPANVSVIGTMNTVDRSLTAMDFAMRRRFEFELVDVEPSCCPEDYGGVDLQRLLSVVNRRVSVLLGADHRIGHAAFMRRALDATVSRYGWTSETDGPLRAVAHIWRSHVIPTLLEYFHADWEKARAVAGAAEISGERFELFDRFQADAALVRLLPDEYDLPEARSFAHAGWWNPHDSMLWKPVEFSNFLQALVRGI